MSGLARPELRRLAEIEDQLGRLDPRQPGALAWFPRALMEMVGGDRAFTLRLAVHLDGLQVEEMHGAGAPIAPLRAALGASVRRHPNNWTTWDAVSPAATQRNRAISVVELFGWEGLKATPVYREAVAPSGYGDRDQLRTLVCEGPALLAWVGALREEPFGQRERLLFQRVVPRLRERLILERNLDAMATQRRELAAVLEELGGAAFITDRGHRIVHANSAGRALLDQDPAAVRSAVLESLQSSGSFRVTAISGTGEHLVIRKAGTNRLARRLASAGQRWKLTRRQREVLALVARGFANKTIAVQLRCAEVTVEQHVTAVLAKAQAGSRAMLLARLLQEAD